MLAGIDYLLIREICSRIARSNFFDPLDFLAYTSAEPYESFTFGSAPLEAAPLQALHNHPL